MTRATTEPVTSLRLPLSAYRGLNPFALDLVRNTGSAARFLPRRDLASLRPRGEVRDQALVEALAASNARWGNDVRAEIDRWQSGATLTIVAGQQVCFAGGPLLVATKIASLVSLKKRFEQTGVPATVFFWLATEDHDFDEIASLTVQTRHGRVRLRSADRRASKRQMVGDVAVPDELKEQLAEALGVETPPWLRPGITFRDSFAELISEVFRSRGVVLVDSMLPELRRSGAPLLERLAGDLEGASRCLDERSRELTAAGYTPQLTAVRGQYSLLYRATPEGERIPIAESPAAPGEALSTGAAARPLLQDAVFRTDVFIGGPSEVAYYAQVAALHQQHGVELPHVALRAHLLAAPARTLAAFERFGLEPRDLFETPERIVARLDPEATERMRQALTEAEERIEAELAVLRNLILESDPSLRRALEKRLRRVRYHFDRIEHQAALAAARSDAERFRGIGKLLETLTPGGEPQDRHTAWLPLWLMYGHAFIDAVIAAAEPDSDALAIIAL